MTSWVLGQVSCPTNSRGDIWAGEKQCSRRRYIQNWVVKALWSLYLSVIHQCFLIFWLLWEVSGSSADVRQDQGIIFSFKGLEHMSWYLRAVRPWMMPETHCVVDWYFSGPWLYSWRIASHDPRPLCLCCRSPLRSTCSVTLRGRGTSRQCGTAAAFKGGSCPTRRWWVSLTKKHTNKGLPQESVVKMERVLIEMQIKCINCMYF